MAKIAALVVALVGGWSAALAQAGGDTGPVRTVWAAQAIPETPWKGVNKPVTHVADILRKHAGQASWEEPVMLTRDYDGRYFSLAPGEKTKQMFYADDRVFGWIHSGQVKITIDGKPPIDATKGFLFDVAPRLSYQIENVGSTPAVIWRVTPAGQLPSYPESETPTPVKGYRYVRAKITSTGGYEGVNQPSLDYNAYIAANGKSRDFAMDGHTSAHIIRSNEVKALPADTAWGHFHENMVEAWIIIEGGLTVRVSGVPLVVGQTGDIIQATDGRWHRAGCTPNTGPCTRLAMTPRYKEGQVHYEQAEPANSGGAAR